MRRIARLTPPEIIILVAFGLRAFRLDWQSLWYDEAFSVYLAQFNLADITARTAVDIQPPLYYYLLHFWISLAGGSEFSVRFLSLVFGVLMIPLMFVAARRLFDRNAAWIAAIIAAFSSLYVWYSQEARMYTLLTFLLLLSSYALWRECEGKKGNKGNQRTEGNQGTRGNWGIVFAVANVAACYTHYFAFVIVAFQFLFTIYHLLFTHHVLRFARYFVAIFAAFLPWTPFVLARFGQDASYWRGALKLDEALRHIAISFTVGESVLENIAQPIAMGWLIVLMIGLGSWFLYRRSAVGGQWSSIIFSMLYLAVPLVLLLFLFSRNPKFNARYLMIASPAFFLLLAAGLAAVLRISQFAFYFDFRLFTPNLRLCREQYLHRPRIHQNRFSRCRSVHRKTHCARRSDHSHQRTLVSCVQLLLSRRRAPDPLAR
ncbi:MAG: glycosyltransferase family 39 protein [Chloroflexi bacterium]|nr:glycosyltransferase family 39 protein [Chloroflexota bacterium]